MWRNDEICGDITWVLSLMCRISCYIAIGFIIFNNCVQVNSRHLTYENERVVLVKKLEYFKDLGTDWKVSESAVEQYAKTLEEVNEFNSGVYFVQCNKDDVWIGLFTDKAYIGIEPIDISQS